jgi:hypothetical protein
MSKIIGVDAAVLAGLEIDLLQKLRNGQITIEQYKWFLGLTKEVREQFVAESKDAALARKFILIKDLGIIEVPADYVHAHLDHFVEANREKFYSVNKNITDENFSSKSTTKLTPGRKLRVRVYKQVVGGSTTSVERMDFLRAQPGNVWLGAQGVTLVWPKREELPKGVWYCSFDEPDALWQDSDGHHRVPSLHCNTDGDFTFNLGRFGFDWNPDHYLLSFCDEESLDA